LSSIQIKPPAERDFSPGRAVIPSRPSVKRLTENDEDIFDFLTDINTGGLEKIEKKEEEKVLGQKGPVSKVKEVCWHYTRSEWK